MKQDSDFKDFYDPSLMATQPTVSVQMLAYNHGKFLGDAIQSVVSQKCDFPIELIIGEDKSPDNSLEIALDYQRRYPNKIRIVASNMNAGMMENGWRTMNVCRGKYIAICEGDDYWTDSEKLATQVELLEKNPHYAFSCHAAQLIDAKSGKKIRTLRSAFRSRVLSPEELILGDGGLIPTASLLLRAETVKNAPAWARNAPAGDYSFVLMSIPYGQAAYINSSMSAYRINIASSWSAQRSNEAINRCKHAKKIEAMLNGFDVYTKQQFKHCTKVMVSKYYSDAIVLYSGDKATKHELSKNSEAHLIPIDKLYCKMLTNYGIPIAPIKTLHRKIKNILRIIIKEFTMPKLK